MPWDKLQAIESTPKSTFRPEHFFDVIRDLWDANGVRPYTLIIRDTAGNERANLHLTGS